MSETPELTKLHGLIGEKQLCELLAIEFKQLKYLLNFPDDIDVATLTRVGKILESITKPKVSNCDFTFIDLFAGIGGIRRGFESIRGQCVFTSEWDQFSQKSYLANYSDNHPIVGDITKVSADTIPDHDVLLAGFPCQPFSLAGVSKKNSLGRRHGFECNTQGTLFFDIERIIDAKRPKAFLLENVRNLERHDKGKTFKVITETLSKKLGYKIFYKVIDANGFVPQHRERIYIAGFREEVPFSWDDFNQPEKGTVTMKDILHPENGTEKAEAPYTAGKKARVAKEFTLGRKTWICLQNHKREHEARGNGFGFGLVTGTDTSRTLSARYHKDGGEILVSRGLRANPRRLTPRECARLMGYPDSYKIMVSNTQAYRQFGNSVVVPVLMEIARIMRPHILKLIRKHI